MSLFLSALSFIFVAALPGRTTFVLILLAARNKARPLFLGAAAAFGAQALISVMLGHLFAFLPQWLIQITTSLLFLYFSVSFWRETQKVDTASVPKELPHPFRTAFLMIFAAEWGDVSQVAIASFAANHPEPWTVLLSAFLALWSIALLAIGLGARMTRIVRPQKIQKAAAVFFAAAGLMIAFRTLRSFF